MPSQESESMLATAVVSAVESDGVLAGVFALTDCFAGAVLVSDFCVACAETGGFETARRAARASAKRVTSERGMWGRMMRVEARFLLGRVGTRVWPAAGAQETTGCAGGRPLRANDQ